MIKSVVFMAIISAVNWQEKWYFWSSSLHLTSESSYFVFSRACAIVPCQEDHSGMSYKLSLVAKEILRRNSV
jgi:hypothetical protein